jgi:hypothetical protein
LPPSEDRIGGSSGSPMGAFTREATNEVGLPGSIRPTGRLKIVPTCHYDLQYVTIPSS